MTRTCSVGIDVGSTYVKAVLLEVGGAEVATARRPTPWRSLDRGRTEMTAADLLGTLTAVLDELGGQTCSVVGIGISGMAESGVLVDATDRVHGPVIAWFDPRGGEELAELPADLCAEFPGRTGLPLRPLATFAKLWHRIRTDGLDLTGLQWLSVPELVATWLGGGRYAETSLVARTGLLDQDTGQVWPRAVQVLGADDSLLPPLRAAGESWGTASRHVPAQMAGAVITVAGHDHLVSSTATGVLDPDTLYDSMGTAEALVRVLDGVLDPAARARLAEHGITVVRHMLPGRGVMLAGTKSGLLMRRALQLVGVGDADGRAALDDQVMLLGHLDHGDPGGVRVSGATNDDGVLRIDADADGLSPALLFEATLCHGSDVLVEVLGWMDREYPPASRSIVAGGWARMRSVRRSRAGILPAARFSERDEDTAVGAALVAAYAADPTADDLTSYLAAAAPAVPHPATSRPAVPRPAVPRPAGDAPTTAGPVPASPHPTPEGSSR